MHIVIKDRNMQTITNLRTKKKRRILYSIQADKTLNPTYYIKVTYLDGFHNSGTYSCKKDLLFALKAFTEN